MRDLREIRAGRPDFYPDQSIYAEFACAAFGLAFEVIDGGTGLVFRVSSNDRSLHFGAGRCSWYPQNSATASTLASDKYFTNRILERAGVPSLGGEYFFLHDRHRAYRPAGHEREDALGYFRRLGGTAFVKPLLGSRGDFAQVIDSEITLIRYLREVLQYYDAILIQPVFAGTEYRIFVLDEEVLYTARKYPPFVVGDGVLSVRKLVAAHNKDLRSRGLSQVSVADVRALDIVPPKGERWDIPGRMNLSAGGTMVLEAAVAAAVPALAKQAVRALGLRAAAVDLFTDIGGEADAMRVIEINANPSIRLLEQSGRGDLILKIWHNTFSAMGLLSV